MKAKHLSIFIPASTTVETEDLRTKTYKVGLIGRSAAIFRVDRIIVYQDDADKEEAKFISEILTYMNTPQYLRKRVFPLTRKLRYVGTLPPLRTPHHPTGKPSEGDYRQGLTLKRTKKGTIVDIGAERPALCREKLSVNKIITFKIKKLAKKIIVEPDQPDGYWGYETLSTCKGLYESIQLVKPDVVIATSRHAVPITSVLDEVKSKIKHAEHLAVLFGGPYSGVYDILQDKEDVIDVGINTIPSQGTETVRTEEAILATLAVFNIFLN